jgi:hypothetical protein
VLAVVEHEQQAARGEQLDDGALHGPVRALLDVEHRRNSQQHCALVPNGCQLDDPNTVGEALGGIV